MWPLKTSEAGIDRLVSMTACRPSRSSLTRGRARSCSLVLCERLGWVERPVSVEDVEAGIDRLVSMMTSTELVCFAVEHDLAAPRAAMSC